MIDENIIEEVRKMYAKRCTRNEIAKKLGISFHKAERIVRYHCSERECAYCGKLFPRTNSYYCSDECKKAKQKEDKENSYEAHYSYDFRVCDICGKKFSHNHRRKYCSDECAKYGTRKVKSTDNLPIAFRPTGLVEASKKASKKNMSYGEYMAQKTLNRLHEEMAHNRVKIKIGSE